MKTISLAFSLIALGMVAVTQQQILDIINYAAPIHFIPLHSLFRRNIQNASTKKISGTFREDRVETPNAPSAYNVGSTMGEFVFIQK